MVHGLGLALAILLALLSGVWGALALAYQAPGGWLGRRLAVAGWSALVLAALGAACWRREFAPLGAYALAFALLLAWWRRLAPSNQRDWADDVARLLQAEVAGDQVTLHNVRHFTWRSDEDYDVRWDTRHYDLRQLRSADAVLSYWSSQAIAHAMISFGFADGRHLVFSVEIRKRRGQAFSEVGGFFKDYERVLIAADERDIIRVRTNVRNERDYLFPLRMNPAQLRQLFLSYLAEAERRRIEPAWYNTITSNCTTIVYRMARQMQPGLPLDIRLLATGYLPQYLYAVGALDRRLPLAQLIAQAEITARARACGEDEDFSAAIRAR